ncbi:hypothetical protein [Cupriavidus sp. IDO]|uniref:hypothetical protein n=1 Tax=Cupriavidus sp. IDO TaxID=1539142 RepID=UPI00187CA5EE|nr:hypothetical protein [Cupriavidus sp. IDO]
MTMREETVISKAAFNQIAQVIQHAWQANLQRPALRSGGTHGERWHDPTACQ